MDDFAAAGRIAELEGALVRAQRRAASKDRRIDDLVASVYAAARDAGLAQPPRSLPKPPTKAGPGSPWAALIHTTDWQAGKRTSTYGIDVLEERLSLMMAKAHRLVADVRRARPIDEVHVLLGGDMVEGTTIFPGQSWEVEAGLYEQLFATVRLIRMVVESACAMAPTIHVWTEYGNHGRIGRKGEQPGRDNVDLMAYRIAADADAGSDRVCWHLSTSWHQIIGIGRYRALLVHGDEINSYGGNHPSYGIVRKVQQWQSGVVEPFRDAYLGHFHRPDTYTLASGGSIYLTGSTESGNEYAREFMAATGRPSQRMHFVDPEKGWVTSEHRLWLDA